MSKHFPIRILHRMECLGMPVVPVGCHAIIFIIEGRVNVAGCCGGVCVGMTSTFSVSVYFSIIRCILLLFKGFIPRVGFEIRDINEVIDAAIDVRHGGLIRRKPPFIIDDKFKSMLSPFKIMNVGKIITGAMHGYLSRPFIECSGNVYVTTAVFPSKDGGYDIIVRGGELGHNVGIGDGHVHVQGGGVVHVGGFIVFAHGRVGGGFLHGGGVGAGGAGRGSAVAVAVELVCLLLANGSSASGTAAAAGGSAALGFGLVAWTWRGMALSVVGVACPVSSS